MTRTSRLNTAALAAVFACASPAMAQETSIRASAWSDHRRGVDEERPTFNTELWGRGLWEATENLEVQAEAWVSSDPVGSGSAMADVREAYLAWRASDARIKAGRQLFAWGRADQLNPTDVFSARDHRRLVHDDNDMRLGINAVTAEIDTAGGVLSLVWAPEFRATRLPVQFGALNVPVRDERPNYDGGQFALRFEQFGQSVDWSVTYAEARDRTPWLRPAAPPTQPALIQAYPKYRMLGGDLATTVGEIGVRAEAAFYDYDRQALREAATRAPRLAIALGADRDFPGQLNVNVQMLLRVNEALPPPSVQQAPIARANASVHYTWRDIVVGGLMRVRQSLEDDRGSVEASFGGFSGGGNFGQIKVSYALADGVRVIAMAERYAGDPSTQLGRLAANNLLTVGIRYGF